MHERIWQFGLNDKNVIDFASYFNKRARGVEASLNYEFVASKVIRIEDLRGNVRKIIGTVVLKNSAQNILKFRPDPNRQRQRS